MGFCQRCQGAFCFSLPGQIGLERFQQTIGLRQQIVQFQSGQCLLASLALQRFQHRQDLATLGRSLELELLQCQRLCLNSVLLGGQLHDQGVPFAQQVRVDVRRCVEICHTVLQLLDAALLPCLKLGKLLLGQFLQFALMAKNLCLQQL